MREGQDKFQKKKVNSLPLSEAMDMKDFLERCHQVGNKKYGHVLGRISYLKTYWLDEIEKERVKQELL